MSKPDLDAYTFKDDTRAEMKNVTAPMLDRAVAEWKANVGIASTGVALGEGTPDDSLRWLLLRCLAAGLSATKSSTDQ